jgi:hypothetical protein
VTKARIAVAVLIRAFGGALIAWVPYNKSRWATTRQTTYRFLAASGEVVQVLVRRSSQVVPADAFVLIFPYWSPLEMWHWGDSLSMGQGFSLLLAPVIIVVGIALIFLAIVAGLAPLKPEP